MKIMKFQKKKKNYFSPPIKNYFLTCDAYQTARSKPCHNIVKNFTNILQTIWEGNVNVICPSEFVKNVKELNPMFRGFNQQVFLSFFKLLFYCLYCF